MERKEKTEFTNRRLRDMIVPLFFEQLLVMLVGIAAVIWAILASKGASVSRSFSLSAWDLALSSSSERASIAG